MSKIFHQAKFEILNSTSLPRYITATESIQNLQIGDEIEIEFKEEGFKASYEVVDVKITWRLGDDGDETYHYNFIVKLINGTIKEL